MQSCSRNSLARVHTVTLEDLYRHYAIYSLKLNFLTAAKKHIETVVKQWSSQRTKMGPCIEINTLFHLSLHHILVKTRLAFPKPPAPWNVNKTSSLGPAHLWFSVRLRWRLMSSKASLRKVSLLTSCCWHWSNTCSMHSMYCGVHLFSSSRDFSYFSLAWDRRQENTPMTQAQKFQLGLIIISIVIAGLFLFVTCKSVT